MPPVLYRLGKRCPLGKIKRGDFFFCKSSLQECAFEIDLEEYHVKSRATGFLAKSDLFKPNSA